MKNCWKSLSKKSVKCWRTISEFFPQWCSDTENKDALTEIRRAFHTLKGSGRMVRALVIGELGWAIENLLNRVLDRSIQPGADVQQVIADVVALIAVSGR